MQTHIQKFCLKWNKNGERARNDQFDNFCCDFISSNLIDVAHGVYAQKFHFFEHVEQIFSVGFLNTWYMRPEY